jgi:alcohol dehydrogenase (cytochrome c)
LPFPEQSEISGPLLSHNSNAGSYDGSAGQPAKRVSGARNFVTRRRGLLAAVGLFIALAAVMLTNSEVRWRIAVIHMKLKGEVPSFGWRELLWNLRPHSPIYLRYLPILPNPDLAIDNPFTAPQDSVAGADTFRRDCSSCHGVDAHGGAAGPNLARSGSQRIRSDWSLYRVIAHGIPGTAMRSHPLPPRTIWQVVRYIQSLRATESRVAGSEPVQVPYSRLLNASTDSTGWYTYSGDYQSHRFSGLSMINARNVHALRMAWQYQSNAVETMFETSPIVANGVLYFTEPPANVVAIGAATGVQHWRYARSVPEEVSLCCGPVNRGVAILDSLIYFGTLDAHLVALLARNGRVQWDRTVADWREGYSITGAPLALKDKIITGVAGGEFGTRGLIAAFNPTSGEKQWQFNTVPSPGSAAATSWTGESWKRGGAPTWLTGSYDAKLNLLYWGVGNPAPNFNGDGRGGDNLYSNSVVALDADSGVLRWHFQFTPHDEHDWDAVQIPVLIDAEVKGERRQLMAWANRNAFFYLLDRKTGRFLLARPFAKQNWTTGIDSTGRPQALASARPSPEGSLVYPSVAGATNWWSPSYSPRTGLLYVPVLEESSVVFREEPRYRKGEAFTGSVSQPTADAHTMVRALDPLTGAIKWEHSFDETNEWHRVGGILSVAGDVVFVGYESVLYALDARTGSELWRFNTGGRISAAPITYLENGKQYVVLAAGRSLMAFTLGEVASAR